MTEPKGYLSLVLHAHLPFIRHPEHDVFLEENWLFEAVTDTYIPIINVLDGLEQDNVDYRLTVSISPTLMNMLQDELLVSRYIRHLDKLIDLSEKEVDRTEKDPAINGLARMYLEKFINTREVFCDRYGNDILNAFRKHRDNGKLELITCAATHGYLPFLDLHEAAVKAQISVAVDEFKRVFGSAPKGMWLPECAYHPGHDRLLSEYGIKYFFVETHGIMYGSPRPRYGVHSPYLCPSGTAVFGRDMESSKAVWSSKEGYPGDHNYREYYRDIGFDLDYDYVRPYINTCGTRINTGIKYHRITGKGDNKELYDRDRALATAAAHAGNFMFNRQKQVEHLSGIMKRKPIIVSPYDAELFGHWWFEGPEWLGYLFRKMHHDQDELKAVTPGEFLDMYDSFPVIKPAASSWGYKGYGEVWLNGSNDWIYRHLHKAADLMIKDAARWRGATGIEERALDQMARELLLAQSSDWPFIMKTGTFSEYAAARVKDHLLRFLTLHAQLQRKSLDQEYLREAENKYNLFKDIDFRVYLQ